jgi:hypothetical protein
MTHVSATRVGGKYIPSKFITRLEQMARDSKSIGTSILSRLRKLQDLHLGVVPAVAPTDSPPTPVVKSSPLKRKRGIEIVEQII